MFIREELQARSEQLSSIGRLREMVGNEVRVTSRVREGEGEESFEESGGEKGVLQSNVKSTRTCVPVQ